MSLPFCWSHLSDPGTIAKLPTRRVLIVNDQLSCNKQLFINLSFLSLFSFLFLFYFHSLRLVYHIHSLSPISRCDFSSFLFCPSVRPSVRVPQPKVKGPFFSSLSAGVNALFVAASAFFFPDIFGWVFPSAGVSFFIEYIYAAQDVSFKTTFSRFLSIFSESLNCSFFWILFWLGAVREERWRAEPSSKKCAPPVLGDEGLRGAATGKSNGSPVLCFQNLSRKLDRYSTSIYFRAAIQIIISMWNEGKEDKRKVKAFPVRFTYEFFSPLFFFLLSFGRYSLVRTQTSLS